MLAASWHGFFSWYGWPSLVAIGTLALAGVTCWLAVITAREVRLTNSIEAERHRPVLVEISLYRSVGFHMSDDQGRSHGTLGISLRNVGLGPALNVRVKAVGPGAVAGVTVEDVGLGSAEAIAVETADSRPVPIQLPIVVRLPDGGLKAEDYSELARAFTISVLCMDRTRAAITDALV